MPEPARDHHSQLAVDQLRSPEDHLVPDEALQEEPTSEDLIIIECVWFSELSCWRVVLKYGDKRSTFGIRPCFDEDESPPDVPELFGMIRRVRYHRRKFRDASDMFAKHDAIRDFNFVNLFAGESYPSAVKRLKSLLGNGLFGTLFRKYGEWQARTKIRNC